MSDHLLESEKHPTWKKFLYAAAFICLMLAGFLMVFSMRNKPEENSKSPLGDVMPQILVQDTVYYWSGVSYPIQNEGVPGKRISTAAEGPTYLPDGFSEYSAFLATVDTPPEKDLQMQADFSGFGTVYRNPEAPEVVYILMTTDWLKDQYIRFASRDIFDGDRICWNGKQYSAPLRRGTDTPLDTLPAGAVSVGTLHYIGQDYIPQNDLETNCISDDIAMSLEGREVFANPDDPEHIYVYSSHLSSGGGYWECSLWKESYSLKNVK